MTACVLIAAPKFSPLAGIPPITPGSAVSVMRSAIFSSLAIGRHALGHADAEIDDAVGRQLERRAAGDDLARAVPHRRQRAGARADFGRIGRIVLGREGLPVVLRLRHHHAIDHHARHLHLPRIERAALGDALDLRDDDAAGIARRHGDGQSLERQRLLLHGQIAVGIAGGRPDDPDIDREGPVEQAFLAVDVDEADEVLLGPVVELAAAVARIDEGAEADARDMPGPMRGDVAEQMRDHALRQIVGLDLVGDGEVLQLRHETPMAADDPLDQARWAR